MTVQELKAEMQRRLNDRAVAGMTHDAYLQTAVDVMFEVVAEMIAKSKPEQGTSPSHPDDVTG